MSLPLYVALRFVQAFGWVAALLAICAFQGARL